MSNSSLVVYKKISPSKSSPRKHAIDTITIHCMAAPLSVESCGQVFQTRQASSNYGVGPDGRIALYVDEKDRSWATSNAANDNRAITIEVACEARSPYKVTTAAYAALINLLVDCCIRNNIKKLLWKGDKNLIGQVNKQNMTVHRWFANKACPGDYLYNKHSEIAKEVNNRIAKAAKAPKYKVGQKYTLVKELKVYNSYSVASGAKKYKDLSDNAKKHDADRDGALDKGTVITAKEVRIEGENTWIKTAYGWIAAYYHGVARVK